MKVIVKSEEGKRPSSLNFYGSNEVDQAADVIGVFGCSDFSYNDYEDVWEIDEDVYPYVLAKTAAIYSTMY